MRRLMRGRLQRFHAGEWSSLLREAVQQFQPGQPPGQAVGAGEDQPQEELERAAREAVSLARPG